MVFVHMNDFTKEELTDLESCVFYWLSSVAGNNDKDKEPLFIKLKNLIDNYCEHDTYETSALIKLCSKCFSCVVISL